MAARDAQPAAGHRRTIVLKQAVRHDGGAATHNHRAPRGCSIVVEAAVAHLQVSCAHKGNGASRQVGEGGVLDDSSTSAHGQPTCWWRLGQAQAPRAPRGGLSKSAARDAKLAALHANGARERQTLEVNARCAIADGEESRTRIQLGKARLSALGRRTFEPYFARARASVKSGGVQGEISAINLDDDACSDCFLRRPRKSFG